MQVADFRPPIQPHRAVFRGFVQILFATDPLIAIVDGSLGGLYYSLSLMTFELSACQIPFQ